MQNALAAPAVPALGRAAERSAGGTWRCQGAGSEAGGPGARARPLPASRVLLLLVRR